MEKGFLQEVKPKPARSADLEVRYLREPQWRAITGMSKPSTFRAINRGDLRALRYGSMVFIPVAELERFFAEEAEAA